MGKKLRRGRKGEKRMAWEERELKDREEAKGWEE